MSASLATVQAAIYARFGAAFVSGTPPTGGWNQAAYPVVAENQAWATTGAKQPTDKAWGRLSIRVATSIDTSADARARRVTGVVWLQIFCPAETGSLPAMKMSDEMERIFGRQTVVLAGETLRFNRAVPGYVGIQADGWDQFRCTVEFLSDAMT